MLFILIWIYLYNIEVDVFFFSVQIKCLSLKEMFWDNLFEDGSENYWILLVFV